MSSGTTHGPGTAPEAQVADHPVLRRAGARGIERLRHFTTNSGVTGILATGQVKSRRLLDVDQYLENIYYPNCDVRRDHAWTGHVSISVTDINDAFFKICSGSSTWHAGMEGFWAIVELSPEILTHDGVVFTTTNNMYSNVQRGSDVGGLEAMFAAEVRPYRPISTSPVLVRSGLASNQPTDPQAEVLYPNAVSAEFITTIVVAEDEQASLLVPQVQLFERFDPAVGAIEVAVDPAAFRARVPGPTVHGATEDVGGDV